MATPEDVPGLETLAYRVPEDVRASMSADDLRIRCQYVLDLEAKADMADSEGRSRNLRRRAEKALKACSPSTYADEHSRLDDELAKASRGGEDRRAMAILEEIHHLERDHPQPPAQFYRNAIMAALMGEVDRIAAKPPPIPPLPESKNTFTRRFGKKQRKH